MSETANKQLRKNLAVNQDMKLYIISHGKYFSCLGFDVVTERCDRYGQWLLANNVDLRDSSGSFNNAQPGSVEYYATYENILEQVRLCCDIYKSRCNADLCQELLGLEGKRVEVVDKYGEKRRFRVGKSTGFIPVHLELASSNSSGGPAVTGAPFQSVRVVS